MRMGRVVLALLIAGTVAVAPLRADPRWWWSDRPIAPPGEDRRLPHVAFFAAQAGPSDLPFVVWEEGDPSSPGSWEIWLTSSPDMGCTWCPPVRLTANTLSETRPRVAAALLPTQAISVQVVYEREGEVVVAWDRGSLPHPINPLTFCDRIAALGEAIQRNGRYEVLSAPGPGAVPDITATVSFQGDVQFHAVWEDTGAGERDIFHARDLGGMAGDNWSAPSNLTPETPPSAAARFPAISADTRSSSPSDAAVSVAFLDETAGEVRYLRSTDSGATWAPVPSPDGLVSDQEAVPTGSPALTTALMPSVETWHLTAWADARSGASSIHADVQRTDLPGTAAPPWGFDRLLRGPSSGLDGPTVALTPRRSSPTTAGFVLWVDATTGPGEIFYRGATLNTSNSPVRDFGTFPFGPDRSEDPSVSENRQLTGCSLDEITLDCVPDRTAGEAAQASATGQPFASDSVFLVWRDTREGVGNIYFKRTDLLSDQNPPDLTWRCPDQDNIELTVRWRPGSICSDGVSGSERVARYRIYHGDDPGGPYVNAGSPTVVSFDPDTDLYEAVIGGFQPPVPFPYYVIVVPEDEAGNLYPVGFDPYEDLRESPDNETETWPPQTCEPILRARCALRGDRCPPDPALDASGFYTLGELAELEITLTNYGPLAVTAYEATLVSTYSEVRLPGGGLVSIPRLESGETVAVRAAVRLDDGPPDICGEMVDLDLIDQLSDGGAFLYGDAKLDDCDIVIGEESGCPTCAPFAWIAPERVDVADTCPVNPRGAGSGNLTPEPDEEVILGVVFRNVGDVEAVGFSGEAEVASGATLLAGASIGPVASLAPGAVHVHDVELLVTGSCGDLVDVALRNLQSGGGAQLYPDEPAMADRWIGADLVPLLKVWSDYIEFLVPDGGAGESPAGVAPTSAPIVERAGISVSAVWEDPDDTLLTLVAPGGATEDVTEAITGWDTDIAAFYNAQGPGRYLLRVQDTTADGNPGTMVRSWGILTEDNLADCVACVPGCAALEFPGSTQVAPDGECALLVSWEAATGEGAVLYDLHRDGGLLVADLTGTTHRDAGIGFGDSHSYQVVARDSCADPGPDETWNEASEVVQVEDSAGPLIDSPAARVDDPAGTPCDVLVEANVSAECAAATDVSLLRGATDPPVAVVATGIVLPHTDSVPRDGTYHYRIRAEDEAGNVTESATFSVEVLDCARDCLYRASIPDRSSFDRGALYQPRDALDIALAEGVYGGLYRCFAIPGELDADVVGNGTELMLYQMELPAGPLEIRREGADLRLSF